MCVALVCASNISVCVVCGCDWDCWNAMECLCTEADTQNSQAHHYPSGNFDAFSPKIRGFALPISSSMCDVTNEYLLRSCVNRNDNNPKWELFLFAFHGCHEYWGIGASKMIGHVLINAVVRGGNRFSFDWECTSSSIRVCFVSYR